uniref:Uncharacterized protein n=1 Tax=Tanacetum cinerariifolium TaxID=118510 RepID=A0A6L2LLI1_TANCI|nr:hypothetical protein [Tanacetum cinerariifolium]
MMTCVYDDDYEFDDKFMVLKGVFSQSFQEAKLSSSSSRLCVIDNIVIYNDVRIIIMYLGYKDNGVVRDETLDIEEDVLVTDGGNVDEDDSIVEDKDQSLNEAKENETVIEEEKNNSCQEVIDVDEGKNSKEKEDIECDQVQNKSSKSYADVTEKNVINFDKKLLYICKEIDSNGNKIVMFDDVMVVEGSKRWERTLCDYFVGYGMSVNELRMGIGRVGFARVLVEVTAKKPLSTGVKIVYKNGSKEKILQCSVEGVRVERSRQNVNEEKKKEKNLVKSKNDSMVDSEGFIALQKKKNGGVSKRVLKPGYMPNTQHTRFVNQKSNMNRKSNVQYEFQPKKKVNNRAIYTVMPVETVMNNTSGNQSQLKRLHIKKRGFGFGLLAVEIKRYKRVDLFSWSVERPLGTSLIGKRLNGEDLDVIAVKVEWSGIGLSR